MNEYLIEILERSVEKNGEKPLTNKWLLNILKQAERTAARRDFENDMEGCF